MPGDDGGAAAVLFGLGEGGNDPSLAAGTLPASLPAGTYHLASGFADPAQASLAWALGAYRFAPLPQASARASPSRPAGRGRWAGRHAHCRRRHSGARSGQYRRQRSGACRTRRCRPQPRAPPRCRLFRDRRRGAPPRQFPAHPRRRRRRHARTRAAPHRPFMGRPAGAVADPGRQGRLFRQRRSRHQAGFRHASDEKGHGRRRQRSGPRPHDHGRWPAAPPARAHSGGGKTPSPAPPSAPAMSSPPATVSPSRSATPTPRAAWCSPMPWRWPAKTSPI